MPITVNSPKANLLNSQNAVYTYSCLVMFVFVLSRAFRAVYIRAMLIYARENKREKEKERK